jgi:hypothetical protein
MTTLVAVALMMAATSTAPAPKVFAHHALLRAPGHHGPVGHLSDGAIELGDWRTDTIVAVRYRGAGFDVDADVDLTDTGTELSVTVPTATALSDTGPWTIVMTPNAKVALGGRRKNGLRVLMFSAQQMPVVDATIVHGLGAQPAAVAGDTADDDGWPGADATCQPKQLYATATAGAPTMKTPSSRGRLRRDGRASRGFTPAHIDVDGFVIFGFARADQMQCETQMGGLGLRGTGGASDGVITAREARLPAGTRVFSDGHDAPIATLHRPVRALLGDDGRWRVPTFTVGGVSLGLHSVVVDPVLTDKAFVDTAPRQHGVGNVNSLSDDWPHPKKP